MSAPSKSVCALLCVAAALTAEVSRADIAPPDVRCETLGAACDNAAPNGIGNGVCSKGVPVTVYGRSSCGIAGAAGTTQTECLFCEVAGGASGSGGEAGNGGTGTFGNAGQAATSAGGAGAANAAGETSSAGAIITAGATSAAAGATSAAGAQTGSGEDGGCSVRQLGGERGVAVFMLGLGLSALAFGRRRR